MSGAVRSMELGRSSILAWWNVLRSFFLFVIRPSLEYDTIPMSHPRILMHSLSCERVRSYFDISVVNLQVSVISVLACVFSI